MRITVVASSMALTALEPLLEKYRQRFLLQIIETQSEVPEWPLLRQLVSQTDALLLVGARKRSPRTVLPGPVIESLDGRWVPVSWLPEVDMVSLKTFAEASAQVHQRLAESNQTAMAVLSQWNPKYLNLAHRIEDLLDGRREENAVFSWAADQLIRDDLIQGLECGLAAAFYVGHGRPVGWVGYHGTRAHHFNTGTGEPLGALLSLCCSTASRKRTGLSFSEALPLLGKTAGSFGAVKATLHADNTRWALGLCQAINQGAATLGELIVKAMPTSDNALSSYRIIGDPMAPLVAAPNAYHQAQQIGTDDEYLTA